MRLTGMILILVSILSIVSILIYKSIRNTLMYIGPKSSVSFIICGILIIIGIRFLLKSRKK